MRLYCLGFLLIGPVSMAAQVLPTANAPDGQPRKGTIEGVVVSLSGDPLAKAKVGLRATQQGPLNPTQPSSGYSATTGADGRFVFRNLPPATYTLNASRVGYLTQFYGAKSPDAQGTLLTLAVGQELKDLVVPLMAQGLIVGKVIDEDGDPAPSAQLAVEHWTYSDGSRQLREVAYGNSQADGSFVIGGLPPGHYVLSVSFQSFTFGVNEDANKTAPESNLPTFYPNAPDATSAALLDIPQGGNFVAL
jgi:hypothetical protein